MALITVTDAQLAFGHVALLDHADFSLEAGERVGLIGRNGAGKSSLLRLLAGLDLPDDGSVQRQGGVRVAHVMQEPQLPAGASVFDAVSEGLADVRALRQRYEAGAPDDDLGELHARIDHLDGWNWEQRVAQAVQRLALDGAAMVDALSGGQRKRVALARALVDAPDVLLLDEPTNHLDLDAIEWLGEFLAAWRGALVLITHDRAFLDTVATRIVELDRGHLRSHSGNYAAFEAAREQELAAEALASARADKLLAQEEVWVRQGVEARRTRSVARVARLERLRAERRARREQVGQVRLALDAGQASGKLVAEAEGLRKAFGDKLLVDRLSTTVLRGDRIGLVGPNGVGKTTLLKLLLGELAPDAGRVRLGTRVEVAYFDQARSQLDLDATLADTISPGSEWIEVGGARKHVMSYLGDFLFNPARAHSPVRTLSGGERARLLLARLFAKPVNVLVLDEPTNDLDIDTLELLEALLQDYPGTVFLVSHDRRFVDAVATSLLVWEGDEVPGRWCEYEGGISDWIIQRDRRRALQAAAPAAAPTPAAATTATAATATPSAAPSAGRAKLSHKEQRELDALPGRIEALEAEQAALDARMAAPGFYAGDHRDVAAASERHAAIETELMALLERWSVLEQRAAGGG